MKVCLLPKDVSEAGACPISSSSSITDKVFPPGQSTASAPGIGRTLQFWGEGSGFPYELDYLWDLRRC